MMTAMTAPASQANAQSPEGTVRLMPGISSAATGQGPFTVFVVLEDLAHYGAIGYDDNRDTVTDREVASDGLAAFEFTIEYDQTMLAVEDVEQGPALDETGRTFQCLAPVHDPGSLSFGCLSEGRAPPGPQGTLTLASVALRPVGPGSSFLVLEAGLAGPYGDDAPVEVVGGAVQITGQPVPASTSAPPGAASTATPRPDTGGGSDDTPPAADATVAPTSTPLPQGEGTPPAPGATREDPGANHTRTPASQGGTQPEDLNIGESELESKSSRSGASIAVWSMAALGSLAAAGTVGLTVFRLRRRRQQRER